MKLPAWSRSGELGWTIAALALLVIPVAHSLDLVQRASPLGMHEDALIGLRHLRHFVEHGRLVYNLETSTLGATSPVFWIVSGLGYLALGAVGAAGDLIGYHYRFALACWVVALVVFVSLGRGPLRLALAAFAVLALTTFVHGLQFLHGGLEGPFLMLSLAVIFRLVQAGIATATVLALAGALAWGRPEIALIAGPALLAVVLWHGPDLRARVRHAATLAIGWSVTPLAMLIFTGNALPTTVRAKAYFGESVRPLFSEPSRYLASKLELIAGVLKGTPHVTLPVCAIVVGYAAWQVGAEIRRRPAQREPRAFPWRLALALFAAGYTGFVVAVPALWAWYVTYWLGFALVVIAVALHDLAVRWLPVRAARYIAAAAVAVALVSYLRHREINQRATERYVRDLEQERWFRGQLGIDLRERWRAASVWMEAAGWQGYFNDARIYDEVGLTDDAVFRFAERDGCGYFMAALRELAPAYIVKRQFELDQNRMITGPRSCRDAPLFVDDAARREFFAMYEQVASYKTQRPGYFGPFSHLVLFRRTSTVGDSSR